jgi:rare lipoprotein A (peptidoglycan hydrolase)
MDDWWADLDGEILRGLKEWGPSTPAEVGRRLGVSEGAATSLLCVLAGAGKVRISLVEPNDGAGEPRLRSTTAAPSAERPVIFSMTRSRKPA